jgi:serine phosphatase RsbU (regulator of sigma subunit)
VKATGGLLGLFKGEQYPCHRLSLRKKDKVIFYTDGVEMSFASGSLKRQSPSSLLEFMERHARMPIHELMGCMERHLDAQDGSLHPADDITLVGLEVMSDAG